MRTADPTVHLTYLFLGCGITIVSMNVQTKYQCHVCCHTLIIICDVQDTFGKKLQLVNISGQAANKEPQKCPRSIF